MKPLSAYILKKGVETSNSSFHNHILHF